MTMTNTQELLENDGAPATGKEAVKRMRKAGASDDLFAQIDAGQVQLDGPRWADRS